MTTSPTTSHVHIDPRFGFSRFSADNPERDEFARLAAAGQHDVVLARLAQAAHVCRQTLEYREACLLVKSAQSIKRQAI